MNNDHLYEWTNQYLKIFKEKKINIKNRINVYTYLFYDLNGKNFMNGGAERYLEDLAKLINSYGYNCNIFQNSLIPWIKKYKNKINIIGLVNKNYPVENLALKLFQFITKEKSILNIYSPFFLCDEIDLNPSLGISHGISWDSDIKYQSIEQAVSYHRKIITSAYLFNIIVSVDTNTPKWFQTFDYELSQKFIYVPNYVDLNNFKPIKKQENQKTIILYPRRFWKPRGLYISINAARTILKKESDVEFHFVGRGETKDTRHLYDLQKDYPNSVKIYSYDFDEMYKAYQQADITIIPTLYSEGTSLSLLEAMASGNAVIATRVGGLTDIVINNFNGLLIEPNEQSLTGAIIDLIRNKTKREILAKNAIETAKTFSKDRWEKQWKKILSQYLT
jgi:glycosyltransferase involved in cell wall biosynthesis